MTRLENNHAMLRDAAICFKFTVCSAGEIWLGRNRGSFFFWWKTDFLGYCSHEGQIHSSGSSSVFAQHLKEESRGLILLGNF